MAISTAAGAFNPVMVDGFGGSPRGAREAGVLSLSYHSAGLVGNVSGPVVVGVVKGRITGINR